MSFKIINLKNYAVSDISNNEFLREYFYTYSDMAAVKMNPKDLAQTNTEILLLIDDTTSHIIAGAYIKTAADPFTLRTVKIFKTEDMVTFFNLNQTNTYIEIGGTYIIKPLPKEEYVNAYKILMSSIIAEVKNKNIKENDNSSIVLATTLITPFGNLFNRAFSNIYIHSNINPLNPIGVKLESLPIYFDRLDKFVKNGEELISKRKPS